MTYRYKIQVNSSTKKTRFMVQFRFLFFFWRDLPRSSATYSELTELEMHTLIDELNIGDKWS